MARRNHRRLSNKTIARRMRADRNRAAVLTALATGVELRVTNRTDVEAGTVHSGLADSLARVGRATFINDNHIAKGSRL